LNKKLEEGNLPDHEIKRAKELQNKMFPKGIPECGTDALRFTLLNYMSSIVRDINFDVERCFGYRTFCNKLWNTVAFALQHFSEKDEFDIKKLDINKINFNNKWIMSRLNKTIKTSIESLENYNFSNYTTVIYDFWMKDLCSVYLEVIKNLMYSKDSKDEEEQKETKIVLYTVIETCLRLLHPGMSITKYSNAFYYRGVMAKITIQEGI
jgi:valyl-tRNA synthetase